MFKKGIKGIIIISVILLLSIVGISKYLNTITNIQYGQIPDDAIPEKFDKVTYTIPTIDEEGNRSTQTFTVDNVHELGKIVKLAVRNNKVKKHEFVTREDVPDKVIRNMPIEPY